MDDRYRIDDLGEVLTPALVVYPEIVDSNIAATVRLLEGRPERWRPHLKTAKLSFTTRRLVLSGVSHFKCATSLELLTACESGAGDVLVALPVVGANARRIREIAERAPETRVSALVEAEEQLPAWEGGRVGLFVDINTGMDRTGVDQRRCDAIVSLVRAMARRGLRFRGLHYYDGQPALGDLERRESLAHQGYDRLIEIVGEVERAGFPVEEIVTAGTPALLPSLSYRGFRSQSFAHRVSPGTVVYNDLTSLAQLPAAGGYAWAVLVVSAVVSRPTPGRVTCDAGHKAISADAGVPTCAVAGRPELVPGRPSEEHLPIDVPPGSSPPELGETLYLVPRHVCPTVNNFDHALLASSGRIVGIERVSARGRETSFPSHRA
jgi:D-serine deaminase-like pyridoxal phosphate-dependent protein